MLHYSEEIEKSNTETRSLNDAWRERKEGCGVVIASYAIHAAGFEEEVLRAVAGYRFHASDDRSDHGIGSVTVRGHLMRWRIDYRSDPPSDRSPDPTDTSTIRVLRIKFDDEGWPEIPD